MLSKRDQLKDRVEARKHELLAKYNELKADGRKEAAEARTRLKARLDELEDSLKSGWANMSEAVAAKLDQWLDREPDEAHRSGGAAGGGPEASQDNKNRDRVK